MMSQESQDYQDYPLLNGGYYFLSEDIISGISGISRDAGTSNLKSLSFYCNSVP